MSLLRTIETRIARLVEGTFGKVFRTSVQPVELARRLVKEMDEHQQRTVRNVYVPNEYEVFLSREDHRQLQPYSAALTTELGEYLAEHARRNSYSLLTRPRVKLVLDRDLALGQFGIAVKMAEPSALDEPMPAAAPMPDPGATMVAAPAPVAQAPATAANTHSSMGIFGLDIGPVALGSSPIRVGRGRSNNIVLSDASVSREHAELVQRGGEWYVRDLDSTNGVSVNGARVSEHALSIGDTVSFGSVEARFDVFGGEER